MSKPCRWDAALALAERYSYPQAEQLLQRYAGHLLERGHDLDAVELYRKVCLELLCLICADFFHGIQRATCWERGHDLDAVELYRKVR